MVYRIIVLLILFSSCACAQYKSYIKYFDNTSYRNSEGDLIVKNDSTYYAAWGQFGTSVADDAQASIGAKRSLDNGRNWVDMGIVQANIGLKNTVSVSLLRIGHDTVHMYFLVKNSNTDLKVYRKISIDDCSTWTAPAEVISDAGYNIVLNAKVRKLSSGRLIMPIGWVADVGAATPYFRAYCYYSDNNGTSWTKSTPELVRNAGTGFPENGIVELSPGNLLMSMRESLTGFQWFSSSANNGSTWSSAIQSTLESTASPAQLVKLSNGSLIAIHNPNYIPADATYNTRLILRISKSSDGGNTWSKVFDLENGPTSNYNFSYPSAVEFNGYLLLTYWETNYTAGRIAQKFASIPISNL